MKYFFFLVMFGFFQHGFVFAQANLINNNSSKTPRLKHFHLEVGMGRNVLNFEEANGSSIIEQTSTPSSRVAGSYRFGLFSTNWLFGSLGVSREKHKQYIGNLDEISPTMQYDFAASNTGLCLKLPKMEKLSNLSLHLKGEVSASWLISAIRVDGTEVYDLKEGDGLDDIILGYNYGFGFELPVTEYTAFTAAYTFRKVMIAEEFNAVTEEYSIDSEDFNVGLVVNLTAFSKQNNQTVLTKRVAALEQQLQLLSEPQDISSIKEGEGTYSVFFPFKGGQFYETHIKHLEDIAKILHQEPDTKVQLIGYVDTDEQQFSKELSIQCVKTVKNYIVDKGVEENRFSVSYTVIDKSNNSINRKVEIVLTK